MFLLISYSTTNGSVQPVDGRGAKVVDVGKADNGSVWLVD